MIIATEGNGPVEVVFPKLMKSSNTDLVVLFTSQKTGTMVKGTAECYIIGEHRSDWISSNFTDFEESVTLRNL